MEEEDVEQNSVVESPLENYQKEKANIRNP
jgi:hypothetical protein